MEATTVDRILLEHAGNPAALFVFPTDIALNRWADRLLRFMGGGSVAMERFTAWDRFKNASIRSRMQDRRSIPAVLRRIFAGRLLEENAAAVREGGGVFRFLIPPVYAEGALSFAAWISSMLPQLGRWFERTYGKAVGDIDEGDGEAGGEGGGGEAGGEDRDLFTLTLRYRRFLDGHGLFEPAWEKPPFDDNDRECFIFFPESLSDFSEYEALLEAAPRVRIVRLGDLAGGEKPPEKTPGKPPRVFFYADARSEITEAALYVRNLAEGGLAWEDIAVSLPEGDEYESYALREFANRDIPAVRRVGKALGAYRAAGLFTGIQDCCSQGFSFAAVSNLLLNSQLPWKNGELIGQLIDFGIKNNCLCSWPEGDRRVDVWLDAFDSLAGSREQRARAFYAGFKSALEKIHGARSFKEILRRYFAFREGFLDMAQCGAEADAVLSRCVSELLGLVEIEDSFPDLGAPDPYGFFIEHLNETTYLAQETGRGVSILPYRTAACAPFACHVVLGASQDKLSMVFSRIGFLPRLKKERLGLGDIDASEAFIALHRLNSELETAFFCSRQSFEGFKIPHSSLGAAEEPRRRWAETEASLFAPDLFAAEEEALARPELPDALDASGAAGLAAGTSGAAGLLGFPGELHEVQAGGFRAWLERRGGLNAGRGLEGPALAELIKKTRDGQKPRISATAMEPYFRCSVEWLYRRVLKLESQRMETTLMAENVTGDLYHACLDRFFKALAQEGERSGGGRLALPPEAEGASTGGEGASAGGEGASAGGEGASAGWELPESCRLLLTAAIREVLGGLPLLPGEGRPLSSLTTRFLRAQRGAVQGQLEVLLRTLAGFFGGFRVAGSELSYELERRDYRLVGKVDLLLTEDGAGPAGAEDKAGERGGDRGVIVDFKLNYLPKRPLCVGQGERGLENFQLPMYVTLAEASGAPPVHTALFFNILKTEPLVVFGRIRDRLSGKERPAAKQAILRRETEQAEASESREEDKFGAVMAEFAAKTEQYAGDILNGRLSTLSSGEARCGGCEYRRVCRTLYAVDGERDLIAPAPARPPRPEAVHA